MQRATGTKLDHSASHHVSVEYLDESPGPQRLVRSSLDGKGRLMKAANVSSQRL